MLEDDIVTFGSNVGFDIVGAPIVVDDDDFAGVHIAAKNLSKDFARVTGSPSNHKIKPESLETKPGKLSLIIIGTVEKSKTIKRLRDEGKLDTRKIEGKWESWMTAAVSRPIHGYHNALVIVGSDKRGAIFGTYTLSQKIGVSPWHWWADVPAKQHKEIRALAVTTYNGEPSVKYRGIFINDECPAMDSWVHEKFGPKFDARVYCNVFELLLRLKANFMWPGMWRGYPYPGRSFFVDDPKNQEMADEYGIVVGTSHHEPMQRAMNEWSTNEPNGTWNWQTNKEKITKYFEDGAERAIPYESYLTTGIRGEGDSPINGDKPFESLREVLKTQRKIIKDKYGSEDGVMQLMALYKEVQQYYEQGLEIPDDVTLLFSDDNFGTLRRLPTKKELKRKGGVGFYYHFEYTGAPRSYRWMNSNTLGKSLHQLQFAHHQGARQIWIFNVGDLKPQELPMSFAFDLAWDIDSIKSDGLLAYFEALALREFGDKWAQQIAQIWYDFDRLVTLRKHEHIEPETFLLLKNHEAENVVGRWEELLSRAEALSDEIEESYKAAFFQLVLHPVKASTIYVTLRVTQYQNQLFAKQRRNTTNKLFFRCIELFDEDFALTQEYHSLLGGKWNHMLRQPHLGYTSTGMAPSRDMISGLCYVQTKADSNPSVGQMGISVEGQEGVHPGLINEDSDRTHPSRKWLERGVTLPTLTPQGPDQTYFEIFHSGTKEFSWFAKPQYDWISLSQYGGYMRPDDDDTRITVTVDWGEVPAGFDEKTFIEVIGSEDGYEKVRLVVKNRSVPEDFTGIVESNGYISIHPGASVSSPYVHFPSMGRQLAGSVTLPHDTDFDKADQLPFLRFPIYTFSSRDDAPLELHFNMTLETDPDSRMEYDIRWDGGDVTKHRLTQGDGELPDGWRQAVQDCVWKKVHNLGKVEKGEHCIEIRFRKPNMCLEAIILDLVGLPYTYLGPPPSKYVEAGAVGGAEDDYEMVELDDQLTINMVL